MSHYEPMGELRRTDRPGKVIYDCIEVDRDEDGPIIDSGWDEWKLYEKTGQLVKLDGDEEIKQPGKWVWNF